VIHGITGRSNGGKNVHATFEWVDYLLSWPYYDAPDRKRGRSAFKRSYTLIGIKTVVRRLRRVPRRLWQGRFKFLRAIAEDMRIAAQEQIWSAILRTADDQTRELVQN